MTFFYKRSLQFFITCGGQKDKFFKKVDTYSNVFV